MIALSDTVFPIPPWEHWAADFDPAPHALVETHEFGGPRTWLLKEREGWIYFRAPLSHPGAAPKAIFGLERRAPEGLGRDAALLEAFFRPEWVSQRWGIYMGQQRPWVFYFGPHGRGWSRPWWGIESNVPFAWQDTGNIGVQGVLDADFNQGEDWRFWMKHEPPYLDQLYELPWKDWTPVGMQDAPAHWKCGSWEELEQLSRWSVQHVIGPLWKQYDAIELSGEAGSPLWPPCWNWCRLPHPMDIRERNCHLELLLRLALRQNVPLGHQWVKLATGWQCSSTWRRRSVISFDGPPSAPEQAAALAGLKRWLSGIFDAETTQYLLFQTGDAAKALQRIGTWDEA